MIEVLSPGPLSLVQDLGRPGLAAVGVGRSGAADRGALRLANRLVGNDEGASGLEATLGSVTLRLHQPVTVAVTGAPCTLTIDARGAAMNGPVEIAEGATLRLGVPDRGLRTYVAVRGGIDVPPVLGSRATDLLSGIGPAPLYAGQRLPVGPPPSSWPVVDLAPVAPPADEPVLEVVPGPRRHWLGPDALPALCGTPYEVSPDSNRIAVRLRGRPLPRTIEGELPSEGLVKGAVQVPPDGQPVVFLADHPVTGGYPVVAVLRRSALSAAAQLRPGQPVRFRAT